MVCASSVGQNTSVQVLLTHFVLFSASLSQLCVHKFGMSSN